MSDLINDINSRLEAVNLQPLVGESISIAEAVETMARIAVALGESSCMPVTSSRIRETYAVREITCWGDRAEDTVLYVYSDRSGILLTNGYDEVWDDLNTWAAQLDPDALTPAQAAELREAGITIPQYAVAEEQS